MIKSAWECVAFSGQSENALSKEVTLTSIMLTPPSYGKEQVIRQIQEEAFRENINTEACKAKVTREQ